MINWESDIYIKDKGYTVVEFICDECGNFKLIRKQVAKRKKYQLCMNCYLTSDFKKVAGKQARIKSPVNGTRNPNYKGGDVQLKCLCGMDFKVTYARKNTAKYCSTTCKKKYSVSKTKFFEYKNIKMRSSWEFIFAQYLDLNNLSWRYEPQSFKTSYGFYTPDFWVEELKSYVEVKGYFRDSNAKNKFEEFSKNNNIILADLDYLRSLGFTKIKSGPKKGQLCL